MWTTAANSGTEDGESQAEIKMNTALWIINSSKIQQSYRTMSGGAVKDNREVIAVLEPDKPTGLGKSIDAGAHRRVDED